MPKASRNYDEQLQILVPSDLRCKLTAIAIAEGYRPEYGQVAKNILTLGVEDRITDMDSRTRKRFEQALISVEAEMEIRRQRRDEGKVKKII